MKKIEMDFSEERKRQKLSKDKKISLASFIKQHTKAYSDDPNYLFEAGVLINQYIDEKNGYQYLSEDDKKTIRLIDYKFHKRLAEKVYIVQVLITKNVKEELCEEDLCEKENVVVLQRILTSFTSEKSARKFFVQLMRDANIKDFKADVGHADSYIKKIEYENSSGNKVALEMMKSDLFTREHDAIRVFNWENS